MPEEDAEWFCSRCTRLKKTSDDDAVGSLLTATADSTKSDSEGGSDGELPNFQIKLDF